MACIMYTYTLHILLRIYIKILHKNLLKTLGVYMYDCVFVCMLMRPGLAQITSAIEAVSRHILNAKYNWECVQNTMPFSVCGALASV